MPDSKINKGIKNAELALKRAESHRKRLDSRDRTTNKFTGGLAHHRLASIPRKRDQWSTLHDDAVMALGGARCVVSSCSRRVTVAFYSSLTRVDHTRTAIAAAE